jgi:lipoprotein-releasing system permease protein
LKGKLFIALRLFSNRMDRRYIPIVNWVSSFAIAIGLASILIVISVMNGFEEEIYKNILKSQPHLVLKNTSDNQSDKLHCEDFDLTNLVKCRSFSQMNAVVESNSVIQVAVIRSYVDTGAPPIAIGSNEIIIDASLASLLGVGYQDLLSIRIPVIKNNALSLARGGSFRVSQIQTSKEMESNTTEIVMNAMAFKNLSTEKGAEHNLILWLEDPFNVQSLATDIKEIIGQSEYEMSDWFELNENLFKAIVIEKAVMTGLLFFVVLIAIFNVMVMISMTIENKKGDIAILKSLGYNQSDVTQVFLIQGCVANILGVLGGIIISLLVLYNLNHIEVISRNIFNFDFFPPGLYILDSMPFIIKPHQFIWISLMTILMGLLASYLPSRITSKYTVPKLMRLYRS